MNTVREEVRCGTCDTNVLVIDVAEDQRNRGQADQDERTRQIAAHGWANTSTGAQCPDCRGGARTGAAKSARKKPAARKGGAVRKSTRKGVPGGAKKK